jgi:hypothetical protein
MTGRVVVRGGIRSPPGTNLAVMLRAEPEASPREAHAPAMSCVTPEDAAAPGMLRSAPHDAGSAARRPAERDDGAQPDPLLPAEIIVDEGLFLAGQQRRPQGVGIDNQ